MKNIAHKKNILISQVIMLTLSIIWYLKDFEIEPLIAIIGFITSLLGTLLFDKKKSGSKITTKKLYGKKGVDIVAKMENSESKFEDIKSNGKINIDIDLN